MGVQAVNPFVDDPDFTLYVGDVRDVLRELDAESVHCVVTSPPYWGLRDYSTEGQLGLEPTPDAYVAAMVEVFREVRRVLRADGTLWLNLGDSYAAQGGGKAEGQYEEKRVPGATWQAPRSAPLGLKPKDQVLIPHRVAMALQADGWYLRSTIIWAKPNPMPESVTDRPTTSHEYVFLLTKSPRYFYDADAVREPVSPFSDFGRLDGPLGATDPQGEPGDQASGPSRRPTPYGQAIRKAEGLGNGSRGDPSGRNLRSVWTIATEAYPEAHFATFPTALVEPCVKAGTSERGCCPECGAPWERQTERIGIDVPRGNEPHLRRDPGNSLDRDIPTHYKPTITTLGWAPSCECYAKLGGGGPDDGTDGETSPVRLRGTAVPSGAPVAPCVVLDPFMGSGTVPLVARKHGRRGIGIELNPEYAQLAARRLSQLSLLA